MTVLRIILPNLGWLLLLSELVSSSSAERNPLLDCDYLCDVNNGYTVSCQRYCPGYRQQPDSSAESHDTPFPTVAVTVSIVSACVVITVAAVIIYKFRNKTCSRSFPSRPCQEFEHPMRVTVEENDRKAKFAGKVEEHEMQSFCPGNTGQ